MSATNLLNQVRNSPPPPPQYGAGAGANAPPPPGSPSFAQLLAEVGGWSTYSTAYSTSGQPISSGQAAAFAPPPVNADPPGWDKIVDLYRSQGLIPPSPPSDPEGLAYVANVVSQPRDPRSPAMVQHFGPAIPVGSPQQSQLSFDDLMAALANGQVPQVTTAMLNRFTQAQRNQWYTAYDAAKRDTSNDAPPPQVAIDASIADWAARGAPMDEFPALQDAVRGYITGGLEPNFYIAKKAGLVPSWMNGAFWSKIGGDSASSQASGQAGEASSSSAAVPVRPEWRDHEYESFLPKTPFEQLEDEWHAKQLYRAPDANQQWQAWQEANTKVVNQNLDLIDPGRSRGFGAVGADVFSNPAAFLKAAELFGIKEYPPGYFGNSQDLVRFNERTGEVWLDPSRDPDAARRAGIVQPMTVGFVKSRAMDPEFAARYDAAKQADQAYWQQIKDYYAGKMSLDEMASFANFIGQVVDGSAPPYELPELDPASLPAATDTPSYALYTTPVSRLITKGPDSFQAPAWVEHPWVKGFFAQYTSQDFHRWENWDRAGSEPFVDHPILGRLPQSFADKFEKWIVRQQPNLDFQGDETGRLYFEQVRRSYGEYWREKSTNPAATWNFVYDPTYNPSADLPSATEPSSPAETPSAAAAASRPTLVKQTSAPAASEPTGESASAAASSILPASTPTETIERLADQLEKVAAAVATSPVLPTTSAGDAPAPDGDGGAAGSLSSTLLANLEAQSAVLDGLTQAVKRYAQLDQFWRLQDRPQA